MSSPNIKKPVPPPPPPEENKPMEFAEERTAPERKRMGTRRLQVPLGGATTKSGLKIRG